VTSADWPIPADLSDQGRVAAQAVLDFLTEKDITYHGGGGRFYSPQEWRERGEIYGTGSLLVITHDGGAHSAAFNPDYEDYALMEELRLRLQEVDLYVEQCTSWYSAVYQALPTEKWLPVVNYEDSYEVSDFGRVRSKDRVRCNRFGTCVRRSRVLKPRLVGPPRRHYLAVRLYRDSQPQQRLVHHLVLEAFVGLKPEGMMGLHRDDNQFNNSPQNLYWGTQSWYSAVYQASPT